jgi:hypothetical protein
LRYGNGASGGPYGRACAVVDHTAIPVGVLVLILP